MLVIPLEALQCIPEAALHLLYGEYALSLSLKDGASNRTEQIELGRKSTHSGIKALDDGYSLGLKSLAYCC